MNIEEERDAQKTRWQQYRDAAARLFPRARVREHSAVAESIDKDGAFVEVSVWVPRAEIEPPATTFTASCTEEGFDAWWAEFGSKLDVEVTPFYLAMAAWAAAASRTRASERDNL